MTNEEYPWIKEESNMTKEEWEKHREWVRGFCGTVIPFTYYGGVTIH